MKKEKKLEKDQSVDPKNAAEKKQASPATNYLKHAGTDSVFTSFQPTVHRKQFEDKSRMPLSSDEDGDFAIDGE